MSRENEELYMQCTVYTCYNSYNDHVFADNSYNDHVFGDIVVIVVVGCQTF